MPTPPKRKRPVSGDRDKIIHDTAANLSGERRNGCQWYDNSPSRVLQNPSV